MLSDSYNQTSRKNDACTHVVFFMDVIDPSALDDRWLVHCPITHATLAKAYACFGVIFSVHGHMHNDRL